MAWTIKHSLLGTLVAITAAASQARATFQYDLRLAPGQPSAIDPHNVALNASNPSTYSLQLWGQISGDSNFNNDSFVYGYVSAESVQGPAPAFTSGGITAVQTGSHTSFAPLTGKASNITDDGITDWGVGSSSSPVAANFVLWQTGQLPGYIAGTTDSESHQVDATTWEILLATFTVAVGGISSNTGTTSINMLIPPQVRVGVATLNSLDYYQDDPLVTSGQTNYLDKLGSFSIIGNVTFSTTGSDPASELAPDSVPEPASLTLLTLGGLTLITRRRRQYL